MMMSLVLVTGLLIGAEETPKETCKETPKETRKETPKETPKAKNFFPEAATTVTITKGTKDTFKAVRVKTEQGYRIKLVTSSSDVNIETTSVLVKYGDGFLFLQVDTKKGDMRLRGLAGGQKIDEKYIEHNHPLSVLPLQTQAEELFPLSGLPAQTQAEGLFPRSGLPKSQH